MRNAITFILALFAALLGFIEKASIPFHGYTGSMGALVKYGEMIADLRGKINGTVHSRNKGGAYMRNLVIPTNPQTAAQTAVRAALSGFSQAWRGLTSAARAAWNGAAVNFPSINVFGDVRELTGISLYNKLNLNLSNVGVAALTSPPAPVGADAVTAVSAVCDESAQTLIVTVAPDPVPADHSLVIEATPQISPGINNFTNRLRKIQFFAAASAGPHDVSAAYNAKFGVPVAGQKVGVRVKLVRTTTGEVSQTLVTDTITVV